MKLTVLVVALVFAVIGLASTQNVQQGDSLEQEIRKLEQAEVDALLRNDLVAVKKNWADDYVVNNPFNEVVDASKGPIQGGTLTYSSFVREVERVLIRGDVVIVMGREVVVPKGTSPEAGKT